MALEARAGLETLSLLSRVLELGLQYPARVVSGDVVTALGFRLDMFR